MTVTDSERTSSLNHPRENQPEAFVGAARGKKSLFPLGLLYMDPSAVILLPSGKNQPKNEALTDESQQLNTNQLQRYSLDPGSIHA